MPWITDENGEKKYILSVYAKEELPVWNEIYNDFYKGEDVYSYDIENPDDQTPDVYWKIPRKKVLLATMCNQLNKLLLEDHKLTDEDMKHLIETGGLTNLEIRGFVLRAIDNIDIGNIIYTIPFPNGKENELVPKSNKRRLYVNEISNMKLMLFTTETTDSVEYDACYVCSTADEFSQDVIRLLLRDVISYYEGEGIGWKDKDGHLVPDHH